AAVYQPRAAPAPIRSSGRPLWPHRRMRPGGVTIYGRVSRRRVPASGEPEVAALKTAQGHVLQHDGVVGIKGDDRIIALLLAESDDGLEVGVGQHRAIDRDVIAALEVGDDVVPEAGSEHERIGAIATAEGVIAGTTVQGVIVVATDQRVIAAAA